MNRTLMDQVRSSIIDANLPTELAFGCACFFKLQQSRGSKIEPRSQKGYFVGYSLGSSGWRIWIPEENRVIESRDVKFQENT